MTLLTLVQAVLAAVFVSEVLRLLPLPQIAQPLVLLAAASLAFYALPADYLAVLAIAGGAGLVSTVVRGRAEGDGVRVARLTRRTPDLP